MTPRENFERTCLERFARLGDVLDAENAALEAIDYARAAEFVELKRIAVADVTRLRDDAAAFSVGDAAALQTASEGVERRVARNARALERAMHVQRRVIEVFGRAAANCGRPQRYGGDGSLSASFAQPPMALVSRA